MGTCHRGGTFYVLRLPQRTAVSSPYANFIGRDPRAPRRNRAPWSQSRCPPATRRRIEEQPEFLCTATAKTLLESDFPWRQQSYRSLTQSRPSRNPDGICRWLGFVRNATPTSRDRARDRQCLEGYETPKGCHCVGGTLHPQTVATMPDHRSGWATPPTIPCFRKEPLGHLSSGRNILRS